MEDYIQKAFRTCAPADKILEKLLGGVSAEEAQKQINLLHAMAGIGNEAGEITGDIKDHFFYGKPLDVAHIFEEMGDLFWFCALLCHELGSTFEQVQEANIRKLEVRYPEKFTSEAAVNRDTEAERKALSGLIRGA